MRKLRPHSAPSLSLSLFISLFIVFLPLRPTVTTPSDNPAEYPPEPPCIRVSTLLYSHRQQNTRHTLMPTQTREKQERVIEAVRRGLDGDAAVEFVCQSGYAMNIKGIARHLRLMGGRQRIEELVHQGKDNLEILRACFPDDDLLKFPPQPPTQYELFEPSASRGLQELPIGDDVPLYETTKMTVRLPTDLYEAIRIAAKAERKARNQFIVDVLESALSRMPEMPADLDRSE